MYAIENLNATESVWESTYIPFQSKDTIFYICRPAYFVYSRPSDKTVTFHSIHFTILLFFHVLSPFGKYWFIRFIWPLGKKKKTTKWQLNIWTLKLINSHLFATFNVVAIERGKAFIEHQPRIEIPKRLHSLCTFLHFVQLLLVLWLTVLIKKWIAYFLYTKKNAVCVFERLIVFSRFFHRKKLYSGGSIGLFIDSEKNQNPTQFHSFFAVSSRTTIVQVHLLPHEVDNTTYSNFPLIQKRFDFFFEYFFRFRSANVITKLMFEKT